MDQTTVFIDQVSVAFDLEALSRKLRIREGQTKFQDRLAELAEAAKSIARPKAVAKLCALNFLDGDRVDIGGVTFTSPLLRQNLGELGRAFCYLTTEGLEMAEWSYGLTSSLDSVFATALRESAVKQAERLLEKKLLEQYGITQVSAMNPGSLEIWPITEQTPLFELLGADTLGVTLLPSLMMKPEYSISGLFFQTEKKYYNCQLCPMEDCPNRKAPRLASSSASVDAGQAISA